jgi:excisionase family DNA binding protein
VGNARELEQAPVAGGGRDSTVSTPRGAPVVRNLPRLLRVREVAEWLSVSTATVYALVKRGELEAAWVGGSLRVAPSAVDGLVARRRTGPLRP